MCLYIHTFTNYLAKEVEISKEGLPVSACLVSLGGNAVCVCGPTPALWYVRLS